MSNSEVNPNPHASQPKARPVGGTEYSWCRAVRTGTGITVLALLLSKPPNLSHLQTALHALQNAHPVLRSKLRLDSAANSFSFVTPTAPHFLIQRFDLQSTSNILQGLDNKNHSLDPHRLILEHELNKNTWHHPDPLTGTDSDLFNCSVYTLSDAQWAVVLRLHTSVCDRAAAVALLRQLLCLVGGSGGTGGEGTEEENLKELEVSLGIEDLIPAGKANKSFWARGVDMLGYSLNSFRLANLVFEDASSPRFSQVVRLQVSAHDTESLVAGCKARGIKLFGALAAAGLIAARLTKDLPEHQREKYAVVTLIDCRSILDPVLGSDHLGFYHSAILNTHDVAGNDELWELAKRCYMSFANAKTYNKHFTDMNDLNFLMSKAIDNPGLTPSSSLRTAFISVFEDPVIDGSNELHGQIGLEDYVGCSSVHGVGPSIAIFDTIRDGQLDCACVYPSPLHSREQMQELVDAMRRILIDSSKSLESKS